ncbi:MAG: WcaI family glycosyltransferase [Verrucomicrobiota bacterium]
MKILVWGINYAPEVTGIAPYNQGLCEFLVEKGHEVHMLTTFPYYPEWKKRPGDDEILYQTEIQKGVQVHRCWHYVPPQPSPFQRIVHEASFVCNAFIRGLFIDKIDRIVLISPPLPLGIAGWILSLWRGVPFVYHIQDLQPDAGIHMGLIQSPLLQRFLYACERLIYSKAAKITVISYAMKSMIEAKGHPKEKIELFPNWYHRLVPASKEGSRSESEVSSEEAFSFKKSLSIPSTPLLLVYSGNFGKKQGLEILVETASRVSPERAHWIFCGDGAAKAELVQRVQELKLNHVHFLPLQEISKYRRLLEESDLCLVSQIGGTGKFFFPSKLLSILSHGKPVLTVADEDSELAHAMTHGFGINHPTHDPDQIAASIEKLFHDRSQLQTMGEKGRAYVAQFDKTKILSEFEELLQKIES